MKHYNDLLVKNIAIEGGYIQGRVMIDGKYKVTLQEIISLAREGLATEDAVTAAQTTANTANTTANSAKNTATTAQTIANTANTTTNSAAEELAMLREVTLDYVEDGHAPMVYRTSSKGEYLYDRRAFSELVADLTGNTSIKKIYLLDCKGATTLYNKLSGSKFTHIEGVQGTKDVTNFQAMFLNTPLTTIDLSRMDVSNATNLSYMFFAQSVYNTISDFSSIAKWNTGKVTTMAGLFFGDRSLKDTTAIADWDVTNLELVNSMFQWCINLTSVDLSKWQAQKIKAIGYWFLTCYNLTKVDVSNCDFSGVTPTSHGYPTTNVFYNERTHIRKYMALKDFSGFPNIRCGYSLAQCNELTYESAMNCINTLGDLTEGGTLQANGTVLDDGTTVADGYDAQTLTFHATTRALLSDEDIAIATAKGWNIAG